MIDMDDGLPSNYITAIARDDEGFMWFGTDNGLCRWDGITATVFNHVDSDSTSLAHDFIEHEALLWDNGQKKLLIGTSFGFSIYDPVSGIFSNYHPGKGSPFTPGNRISAFIKDDEGVFWITTDNGLAWLNSNSGNIRNFYYKGNYDTDRLIDSTKVNTMLALSKDLKNDSVFWIGTRSGLIKFNKFTEKFTLFYYEYLPRNIEYNINVFRSVLPHPNGKLYLGTWISGMVIFDTKTEKFLENFRPSGDPERKTAYDGTNPPIKYKSDHEIWLSTVTALTIYDTEKDTIVFTKSYKNPAGKDFPLWLSFIYDKKEIWCGSRYGVYKFDKQSQQFDNFFFKPSDERKTYITWDIFEDPKSGLIFMAEQGADGLHYFDPAGNKFSYLHLPVGPLKEATVNSIFQSADGTIWIICPYGLYKLSDNRKRIIPVLTDDQNFLWLQEMVEDHNGKLWTSSLSNGIQRFNTQSVRLENIRNWRKDFEDERNVPDFLHLLVDKDNRIWYNRQYGGYGYYDIKQDSAHNFFMSGNNDTGFYLISSFTMGKDNIIWAGDIHNGLGFIDPDFPEKGVWPSSKAKSGLRTRDIYNIRFDDNGRLWMLTKAGLEMFEPSTGHTALFNQHDGMIMFDTFANRQSYYPGSLEKLSDGRMVIGYRRGLGFFHPDSMVGNRESPVPYITQFKIFEKELATDTALLYKNQVDLTYRQNFLTLEYSAISLIAGSEAVFYHQLKGVDRTWILSPRRFASYSNLAPGNYNFRIKAQSGYGLWSEKPVALSITIHPPWWKTWWAYGLYFLAFTGSLFGLYRFQLNRQLVKREASRLKEMDEIKSRLYTNITHEFRTPLTVITGMTEEIKSSLRPNEQSYLEKFLDMIKRNADSLLHLVNQMLELSKLENGMLELNPIQADVVPYLQYITESYQSYAESKGIKLVFYNEREKVVMDYDPDKLFTIISNLLSNAIKFTRKGGKVICHLNTSGQSSQEALVLKITDTGIGIPEAELPNIFNRFYQVDGSATRKDEGTGIGLSLVKELLELMNGTVAVKSQEGKGSEFTVRIPITQKAPRQTLKIKEELINKQSIDKQISKLPLEQTNGQVPEPGTMEEEEYPLTLIIEDNEDVANYIALCLGGDYKIHYAKDGSEGIDKALKLIPDIIISDVMMPEKDGFEVCSFLKQDERTSHIPIILLTAKATREDRLTGLMHGADAYLSKPFDKKELSILMKKMIELRKNLREKFSRREDLLQGTAPAESMEDLFIRKAIMNIENNIDNSGFGTLQLARLAGMSESQLYRKLKALTGKSTAVFIRSVRLQKARELLKTTGMNVSEIAYMTGFNDPAWFSRVFKEEFGESPGGVKGRNN
ncbi:MAG: helix-turn-helix domain-containing protein [Bacteroidetes bacterium]|nr:helix-turn-helix domain-containing protein [Bacteroidota bacterium]